jgi:hypothetical protein
MGASSFSRPGRMAGSLWNLRPRRKPADSDTAGAAHQGRNHLLLGRARLLPTPHASHGQWAQSVSPDTTGSGAARRSTTSAAWERS